MTKEQRPVIIRLSNEREVTNMKNIMFIYNEDNDTFELNVDGECITDCFSTEGECGDLIEQLNEFADVPIYKRIDKAQLKKILYRV